MQGPSEDDDTPSRILKEGFEIHHQEQLPRNRAAYVFSRVRPTACPRKPKVLERATTFKNVVHGYASRQEGELMPCMILNTPLRITLLEIISSSVGFLST